MNKQIRLLIMLFAALLGTATTAAAQVAAGGNYTLAQAVIASGGGTNSTGGNFTVDGTIRQTAAGTRSIAAPFAVDGGFWTANNFVPTAVSISGRVVTLDGSGLRNARVTLTAMDGGTRTVLTGIRGNFRFADVEAGEIYIISVTSRRYQFQTQVLSIVEDLDNLVITAAGQNQIGLEQL